MSIPGTILAARIRTELVDIEQVVTRTQHLLAKAQQQNDEDYLDGVALNLHGFYAGAERLFEEIAREIDGSIPSRADWHRALLIQMASEILERRPAVIDRDTRNCLDIYRGFRHVVRNIYTFNLEPGRLRELVNALPHCYASLARDLHRFCDFLEQVDVE
ncbi:hypothetical protein C7B65_21110 [Phormidesmis priestleyi ULC007]|uniref:HepT-like domain-containing protein n=1 Tax=Phormidesmis priestleyi ULC007 TaxID=1920490 RepID=A0A2T1D844_9CYAN|nr:hypothetical protein [Phormidesmis priestleyi]PSB16626.1 hypothetical protein C7B65_21110 [Phormidesmis priestleyi ULC007]PZO47529.1 MAG: hypothetical protein DCF14_19645 [Phormidesmis priestleyi]